MEIIDNISKTLKDDLKVEIKDGSKLSVAAACFSIYAFGELKDELKKIDEMRFIFTSLHRPHLPPKKQKRKNGSFIFLALTVKEVCTERNLK